MVVFAICLFEAASDTLIVTFWSFPLDTGLFRISNVIDIILPVDTWDVSEEVGEVVSWSDGIDGGNMMVESFVAFSTEGADVEEEMFTLDCPLWKPMTFTLYHLVGSGQDNFAVILFEPSLSSV